MHNNNLEVEWTLDGCSTAELHALLTAPQACISLNANLPARSFYDKLAVLPDRPLQLAADGAALKLQALGVTPDLVIGDLDSLGTELGTDSAPDIGIAAEQLIHIADQNSNDFEKCLRHCLDLNLTRVLVLGLHGGELEHTLNNWSVFSRFARQMSLCVYDAGRYAVAVHKQLRLPTYPEEMISFVPQPTANMTSSGVRWPLTAADLGIGVREGARNRATADWIELQVHSGVVLTFCDATHQRF